MPEFDLCAFLEKIRTNAAALTFLEVADVSAGQGLFHLQTGLYIEIGQGKMKRELRTRSIRFSVRWDKEHTRLILSVPIREQYQNSPAAWRIVEEVRAEIAHAFPAVTFRINFVTAERIGLYCETYCSPGSASTEIETSIFLVALLQLCLHRMDAHFFLYNKERSSMTVRQ